MTVTSSLHRLADACLLPGFAGTAAPDWIRRRVAGGLGGVVLYARNTADREEVALLTASLRAERPDVLVGVDEEGGDVTRLEATTGSSYPGNLALGTVDDLDLTRAVGACLGADLAGVGIDLALAPVADVNSNLSNPVIGVRSFGAAAARVAAHTVALVEGIQSMRVAACVKHFPGHGDTAEDSHLVMPTVHDDADRLDTVALVPFRAAIDAGVRCIMTAHLRVLAYDAQAPATMSRRIMTGLLREELGFDGLAITDALEMRAISATVGMPEGAAGALAAGVDALCLGADDIGETALDTIRDAVVDAVRSGRLPESRLAEAASRTARVGAWTLAGDPVAEPDRGAGLAAARRAVEADGDARIGSGTAVPLVVELSATANIAVGATSWGLASLLAENDPAVEVVRVAGPETAQADGAALRGRAAGREVVLVLRDLHRHAWQQQLVERLIAAAGRAVVVEMGLPVLRPPGAAAHVRTYGAGRVNARAALERLGRSL